MTRTTGARPRVPWLTARSWRRPLARHRRLLVAGLLAAAAATALRVLAPAPAPTEPVIVATRDLPVGVVLTEDDVRAARWPRGTAPAGVVGAAVGRRLTGPVRQGEPITDVRLRGPAVLIGQAPSARAVVVRLATPTAGLVRPGDRVDVVAVGSSEAPGAIVGDAGRLTSGFPDPAGSVTTRVVAENALVLAGPGLGAEAGASDGSTDGEAMWNLTTAASATSGDVSGELLVLAVGRSTAIDLAGVGLTASLSVVLRGMS